MRAATPILALLACLLTAAPAGALEQKLIAADGASTDYLGWDVDVDGDTAVVGAVQDQSTSPGLVYVFTRTGDSWNQTARLQAGDSEIGDRFGQAVAIDGDTIVVGAPRHTVRGNNAAGAVYTFDRTGAPNRAPTAKLTIASPANTGGQLGSSVAIDGDVIAAGARADSSPALLSHGAVYTFTRTGAAQRSERSRLIASDREQGDQLGESVDIDGDTIVAGAWRKNGQSGPGFQRGTAYTFDATATGTDAETAKLVPTDASALDQFGFAVGIEGDTIVVSANRDSFTGRNYVGSAYTFARTGSGTPGQTGKLIASDGLSEDGFGFSVAIDGPTIAVGSYLDDNGTGVEDRDWGSVYTYARSAPQAERSELAKLRPANTARDDYAGFSVALDGDVMIVGSSGDDVGTNLDQGSATIYFSPATGAACSDTTDNDGDGKADFPADPGCTGPDDTDETDPVPGATPTPTPTPTPTATPTASPGGPVGPAPTPPATGSETPRIVRPRTQPPVVVKARVLRLFTIWECRPDPDGTPCKGFTRIVLGRFEDELRAAPARAVTIGSGSATLASGARKPVTAKLSKQGLKLLRRRGKLKARAIVTLAREGAATARATVPVTLKAPKPR